MFEEMIKNNRPNRNKDAKRKQHDTDVRMERQKTDRKQQLRKVREQEAMSY